MSNRYSRVLPIALAVSSVVNLLETNTVKQKSTKEKVSAANDRQDENKKDAPQIDLEIIAPESIETAEIKLNPLDIQYSLEEQFLAEQFYKPQDSNYNSFVSGNVIKPAFAYESDDKSAPVVSDSDSEMLTVKEAEELFSESQSACLVGAAHDVSAAKRRKLDYFAKFEPAYFGLFMAQALTREVNFNSY